MTRPLNMHEHAFPVNKELFRTLGSASLPSQPDDFLYRVDMDYKIKEIHDPGFRMPRKFHTKMSDQMSLGAILEGLPNDKGLFRLGWFTDWITTCRYIGKWKHDKECVVVTRVPRQEMASLPGVQICEDFDVLHFPMMGYSAVLSYVIEDLEIPDQEFSRSIVPFSMAESLREDATWATAPFPMPSSGTSYN